MKKTTDDSAGTTSATGECLLNHLPNLTLRPFDAMGFTFRLEISDVLRARRRLLPGVQALALEHPQTLTDIEHYFLLQKLSCPGEIAYDVLSCLVREVAPCRQIILTAREKVADVSLSAILEAIAQHAETIFHPHLGSLEKTWELEEVALDFLVTHVDLLTADQLARLAPAIPEVLIAHYETC